MFEKKRIKNIKIIKNMKKYEKTCQSVETLRSKTSTLPSLPSIPKNSIMILNTTNVLYVYSPFNEIFELSHLRQSLYTYTHPPKTVQSNRDISNTR